MKKLYMLVAVMFLSACGDGAPPPAWDGYWISVEDGGSVELTFKTPYPTEPDKKLVVLFEKRKFSDTCSVENALVNEVIMICSRQKDTPYRLTHKGESIIMTVDEKPYIFVRQE